MIGEARESVYVCERERERERERVRERERERVRERERRHVIQHNGNICDTQHKRQSA